jgi:hypothetical protein
MLRRLELERGEDTVVCRSSLGEAMRAGDCIRHLLPIRPRRGLESINMAVHMVHKSDKAAAASASRDT